MVFFFSARKCIFRFKSNRCHLDTTGSQVSSLTDVLYCSYSWTVNVFLCDPYSKIKQCLSHHLVSLHFALRSSFQSVALCCTGDSFVSPSLFSMVVSYHNLQLFYYIYTTSKKYLATLKILFLILKVLFQIKQLKHHNVFMYNTKYKSSSVSLISFE